MSLLENRWSTIITGLPLIEYTQDGDTQTVHHYSYYFVEEEEKSTPSGYKSSYVRYDTVGTDNEIELGDDKYRINYDGEHVTIKNTKDTLRIHKEWRGVAKSDWPLYPDTVFDLYGANQSTPLNNATDGTLIRSGLHLNKTNNWEWMPEDENWGEDGFPHFDYYYVVERTDQMGANAELGTPAWDSQKYLIWMYYNETGSASQTQPWVAKTSATGSITIMNALHDQNKYVHFDLKKKWMEWGTPTSWDTTTGVYKRLHDLVMGVVLYRRVWDIPVNSNRQYPDNHIISPGPMGWSDYGNEILIGYDSNGQGVSLNPNTFDIDAKGGDSSWHWTINNNEEHNNPSADRSGPPSEGWYTYTDEQGASHTVWAYFEYTVRETGIWKNLKKDPVDDPEISWFSNSVPMVAWYGTSSQHYINEFNRDIQQDQDRLMNGAGFDMYVEKQWDGSAWDAREVYVKIYRQSLNGQYKDDFTKELARDIKIGNLVGYLNGNESMVDVDNEWIVFTPSRPGLYIDKVLKGHVEAAGSNPYVYWLVEVGYKDKHGNVHMYDTGNNATVNQSSVTSNDLLKLTPTYYTWQDGHYISGNKPGQNNPNVGIVVGDKGTNKLMVKNTPVRDFAVVKKWQNAAGDDISNDPDVPSSLNIKIKQIRSATIGEDMFQEEGYLTFGDSQTLTLTKENSDNSVVVVAQTHPGNDSGAQSYSATISNDTNVGGWGLYISGLEEKYYDEDGNLWTCTYKVEEQTDDIPDVFVTEVSYDGIIDRDNRNITINNVKMEGGMLKVVKQIADGSDYETEDPFEITVKLTPTEGEAAFYLDPGKTIADYIEVDTEDTILLNGPTIIGENNAGTEITITLTLAGRGFFTIKNLHEGTTYEVTEEPGTGWQQQGDINYSNLDQTIVKKQLDTATVTNEEVETSLAIKKIFDGSLVDSMTDEQKRNITFEVTGPNNFNETFTYGVDTSEDHEWSDGVHRDPCTWNGSVLTITKVAAGNYTVIEHNHELEKIYGNNIPENATHTWTYQVNGGMVMKEPEQANAIVENGQQTMVLITNTYDELQYGNFDIVKVAKGTTTRLPGASFTIQEVEAESTTSSISYVGDASKGDPETTGNDGKVSFNNIKFGYYEVKETKTPPGYIITGDDAFYVKIDANGIKLLEKEVKDGKLRFKEATTTTVGNVTIGTQGSTVIFTVVNEPGAALPNAGGPGTTLFRILGTILIAFAAAGLVFMRKRSKAV